MASKISFKNCLLLFFLLFLIEVKSWTIDLPEIRKYVFENNDFVNKKDSFKDNIVKDQFYYSNREGNSLHNSKHYEDVYENNPYKDNFNENNPYAKGYGYQTYMEKKVHNIVYKGSHYLEGLQRALNNYTKFLESCTTMNRTMQNPSWRPAHESNFTRLNFTIQSCEKATRASEHVRRLSELALWTTRELQDIAYSRKYNKGDVNELTMEENELILKLAWFLDRLAHYTGYEPNVHDYLQQDERPSTTPSTTPMTLSLMNAPEDVKRQMLDCLKQKSDVPATVRCAYPLPMPPLAQLMQNYSDEAAARMMGSFQNEPSPSPSDQVELLVASETFAPKLTPVKRQKRQSPAVNFLNHFTKTKIWLNDNLQNTNGKYEVTNHLLHSVQKRAIGKIVSQKFAHLKLPEDPFQDLSKYVKHRKGVNYIKDETQADKIKDYMYKIHHKDYPSKKSFVQKLRSKRAIIKEENQTENTKDNFNKINKKYYPKISFVQKLRPKRSVKFLAVDKPRESEDPQQDISYYIKNKEGTELNPNPIQALQVQAGLQQVFETGNIEVIRRFGANYNPLVLDPFMLAVIKSGADNI